MEGGSVGGEGMGKDERFGGDSVEVGRLNLNESPARVSLHAGHHDWNQQAYNSQKEKTPRRA
jgi:hypothetical protein